MLLRKTANELVKKIQFSGIKYPIYVVGSLRRKVIKPNDIDLLVVVPRLFKLNPTAHLPLIQISNGDRRWTGYVKIQVKTQTTKIRLDIFAALENELAFALYHHTGSVTYNVQMRARAKLLGMKLNQYGLFKSDGLRRIRGSTAIKTEKQLAAFLELPYLQPEYRT